VAARLAGEDVLLMAYTREDCRELSRVIRDDLIHLAAAGPAVPVGGPGDVAFGQLGQGGPDLGDGQAHPLAGADHGDAA